MTGVVCASTGYVARLTVFIVAAAFLAPSSAVGQTEVVLHATNATARGDWQRVPDTSAAGGARLWNPDRGTPKLGTALASPADYFDLTFFAQSGRGYRLWVRGRADNDSWANDSVFVQFSGSVNAAGAATFRIGSSAAAMVSVEQGNGYGLAGWGWSDNGWDSLGPLVYFQTTGQQTVRVQRREDGVSIDQIVLSAVTYATAAPGRSKTDATVLPQNTGAAVATTTSVPPQGSTADIVLGAGQPSAMAGTWRLVDDPTAAGGRAAATPDAAAPKVAAALATPSSYVDYTFQAEAGRAYRLWVRGRAQADYWGNDSVFVQFSGSVDTNGSAVARIGTTGAFSVNLEDASGAGLAGWGWQDNGWGTGVLGPLVMFTTTGTQTIRFQAREDGMRIDQIVLSADRYLTVAPGALKNDATNLLAASETPAPAPAVTSPTQTSAPSTTESSTGASTTTSSTSASSTSASTDPGTPVRLRVLTWNLHHGVGTDGVYDLARIADWMASGRPDVILLTEVEKFTSWGYEDQPERYRTMLEARTGKRWYSHYINGAGVWSGNGVGNQILSTYPMTATHYTVISYGRVAGLATILVNGRTVNLVVTHLDPNDQSIRLLQAREVMRWSAGFAENRILAGDMNAWPDQASIAELNTAYNDTWTVALGMNTATGVAGITPYGATKRGRIDYVFTSKEATNVAVVDATVLDTRNASGYMPSDHRPLLVTLEVR